VAAKGRFNAYWWAQYWNEEPELFVPDVVRGISSFLIGLRGVNVAFDSGLLGDRVPLPVGWEQIDGHAVSPPATPALLSSWPRSEDGFDEWYFFREVPTTLTVEPFCNWLTFRLENWEILRRTENGFDLPAQLERLQPEVMLGEGHSIFVVSRNEQIVDTFMGLACEP